MISAEKNLMLTRVGRGTEMGELLRRYWWPIAPELELRERGVKAIRLLGEDLVLYRSGDGEYGLIARRCPHRQMDLEHGLVEERGLRCPYHGWMFDKTGECIEQPFESVCRDAAGSARKLRTQAYPVQSRAGLLWAYLGPEPVPCLADWDRYYDRGYKQVMFTTLPCNWLQCQENSIDPVHFEWLHEYWDCRRRGEPDRRRRHINIGFDEFEYGFIYRRIYEGGSEQDESWRIGRVLLWPNGLFVGGFDWTIPIDDNNTLRIRWTIHPLPGDRPFEQAAIPYFHAPAIDAETGRMHTAAGTNQDYVAMVSQGVLTDRTKEHLGASDRGIVMMRKRLQMDLEAIARGEDPKAVLRDAARNVRMPLPCMSSERRTPARVRPEPIVGQPRSILDELERVWAEHSI